MIEELVPKWRFSITVCSPVTLNEGLDCKLRVPEWGTSTGGLHLECLGMEQLDRNWTVNTFHLVAK